MNLGRSSCENWVKKDFLQSLEKTKLIIQKIGNSFRGQSTVLPTQSLEMQTFSKMAILSPSVSLN